MPLKTINPAGLNPAQKEIHDRIASGPRGGVRGPFTVLLHSPGLTSRMEAVGAYLRYESKLPARVRELAICTVARHWRADVEWTSHAPLAAKAGVSEGVLAALGRGEEPGFDKDGDRAAWRVVRAALAGDAMPEDVLAPALAAFGEEGVVDLVGIAGYYSTIAMMLVCFSVPAPAGTAVPWAE